MKQGKKARKIDLKSYNRKYFGTSLHIPLVVSTLVIFCLYSQTFSIRFESTDLHEKFRDRELLDSGIGTIAAPHRPNYLSRRQNASRSNLYQVMDQTNPIYGHIHIAKTAGTTLNGVLAMKYERVCGHKGYSFDFFRVNQRTQGGRLNGQNDSYSIIAGGFHRGRIPIFLQEEIGFEDCDYISLEDHWVFWIHYFRKWPLPLELHVPCREPIDHLLSQCNHQNVTWSCESSANITELVSACQIEPNRFSMKLTRRFPTKCFNSTALTPYLKYMSHRLQQRRIQSEYIHRPTNKARNKELECIWKEPQMKQDLIDFLIEHDSYYRFCNDCIGSENDVLNLS